MEKMKKVAAVAAAMGMFAFATPAFAAINSSSITILITNRGSITNLTQADSHTGQNLALGSQGGNGGAGGLVQAGNATSDAGSENGLNGSDVDVELGCDCPDDINSVTINLEVDNDRVAPTQNNIDNVTQGRARTGQNLALGSAGGDAGDGGVVSAGTGSENNGGASAGTGGAGGAGGLGGTIGTGNASSTSGSINLLNTTLLRVRI